MSPIGANHRKRLVFLLTGIGLLLCGGLLFAAKAPPQISVGGDACVRCHVAEFTRGNSHAVKHPPFWERQCTACHLEPGSSWSDAQTTATNLPLTGTPVSQEPLWRKQQVFGKEIRTTEHLVSLRNLNPENGYRFRLQIAEVQASPLFTSLWLGLRPTELLPPEIREISLNGKMTGNNNPSISSLNITSIAADTLLISWETRQPLFSWLELQELDGVEFTVAGNGEAVKPGHPQLRERSEQAINACYQCHPESTLGTSHPVRLYGGRDVRIPEELPTVDGMLTCVTCHDPHGAPGKMLVREEIKTKLCITCHYKYKNSSPSTMFR